MEKSRYKPGEEVIILESEPHYVGKIGKLVKINSTNLKIHNDKIIWKVQLGSIDTYFYEEDFRKLTKLDKALK